jgi:hypothetical protein
MHGVGKIIQYTHKAILIILGVFRKQTNAPIYNSAHSFFLLQLFVTKSLEQIHKLKLQTD